MKRPVTIAISLLATAAHAFAQTPAKTPPPRPAVYRVWAGDLNGDKKSELLTWNDKTRLFEIRSGPGGNVLSSTTLENYPRAVVIADVDGDGKNELVIGEGLSGYNPKDGPQTAVHIRIYEPLEKGNWTPTEIYRADSERPEVTSLEVVNLDADREPEILFSYMASKYQAIVAVADRSTGSWQVANRGQIRMGMNVSAGDVFNNGHSNIVVGRPYGDPQEEGSNVAIGDAFVLNGDKRVPLPVFRGVSSISVGNVDADKATDIVVGDGWHMDYGKVARSRLAVMHRAGNDWKYEVIEDIPQAHRVEDITLIDIDHDGKSEMIVWGSLRKPVFEGIVRIYRRTAQGWQGATLADSVQSFAIGDFAGTGKPQIVFAGEQPRALPLNLAMIKWDAALAPPIETIKVDPKTMIGKAAPEIRGDEWIGEKTSLADLKGKVVLIDFWATWCGPCIKAFPTMKQWLADYGPQGFAIIGMTNHSNQTSQDVRDYLAKHPLPWVVPIDATNRTHLAYGTGALPHQVLIDRQGNVFAFYNGSGETLDKVAADIKELLTRK